jgi:hypothetical protein
MLGHCSVTQQRFIPVMDPIIPITGKILCICREDAFLLLYCQCAALELGYGGVPNVDGLVRQVALLASPTAPGCIPKTNSTHIGLEQVLFLVLP